MSPHLTITIQPHEPAVARLEGELDLDSAPQLLRTLSDWVGTSDRAVLHISCRDITFIDSTGLHTLCLVVERAAASGRVVRLAEPSRPVQRLLDLTGLREVLLAA